MKTLLFHCLWQSALPAPTVSQNLAQAITSDSCNGSNLVMKTEDCIQLLSRFWGRQITVAKGWSEQCTHLTIVLIKIWLKPSLEDTNFCNRYINMTVSQSSYFINSAQPRAPWALSHSNGLHTRTSPWVGKPLRVTPRGWEIPCYNRFSVIDTKLWNLS